MGIIAAFALIAVVNGVSMFFAFKDHMDTAGADGDFGDTLGAILLFSTVGGTQLGMALIGLVIFIIALPVSIYLIRRGI
jgi:hypothetical protein